MVNLKRLSPVFILALFLGACATQFNVPPVTTSATGKYLPGKIIWHDLLTDTPQLTQTFYAELFGWEFRALTDKSINYKMIYLGDQMIGGMVDQNRLPNKKDISQWVIGLSVTDIEQAARAFVSAGGTVFTPPTSLGDRGEIAIVADQQGALLALLQTRDGDPMDSNETTVQGGFLWNELWAGDVGEATKFYSHLAKYSIEEETLGSVETPVEYRVLKSQGRPRAGIRLNPVEGLAPMWVSYLRVADEQALDKILARVEPLGGRILVPATRRPGGGMVAVVAGPSGAGIALQTWSEGQTLDKTMEVGQ